MHRNIFGALVARSISFPEDIEFTIVPLQKDGSRIGPSYTMTEHHSWDWIIQQRYSVTPEDANRIKAGDSVSVFVGGIYTDFPDGTEFPEGSDVKISEK